MELPFLVRTLASLKSSAMASGLLKRVDSRGALNKAVNAQCYESLGKYVQAMKGPVQPCDGQFEIIACCGSATGPIPWKPTRERGRSLGL